MNHEFIGKTIKGKPRGVPTYIFNQDKFEGKIYTASGWPLSCYVSPERITLTDPKNSSEASGWHPSCGFRADVANQVLTLSIYSKGFKGDYQQKHPDLFAAELLKASFNYFNRQNTKIDSVLCHWEPKSDTYQQFIEALDLDNNPKPSLERQLRAAQQTWTAKQIALFGFTKIVPKTFYWANLPKDPVVICLFTKPKRAGRGGV